MDYDIVDGDLLDQTADVIVNAWNRNIIPWWLLIPQGVSGAIKRRAGLAPFRELGRAGPMPLGSAVLTSAGRLPYRGIIHVAGINLLWRASERSIRDSVQNALALSHGHGFRSVALPVIGAGSGGFDEKRATTLIANTLAGVEHPGFATLVRYRPQESSCTTKAARSSSSDQCFATPRRMRIAVPVAVLRRLRRSIGTLSSQAPSRNGFSSLWQEAAYPTA
jgi:O-acetyl-ADP-ribose deacetylase (regulator of RNase III)